MSIKYSIAQMRNPQRPDEPGKFYAKAQAHEEVSLDKIADEIAYASAMTDGDVLNVLRGLIKSMKKHLHNGAIVSLGDFGKFQYLISSNGANSYDEFSSAAHIRKLNIRFRPGKMLEEGLSKFSFERVISVKSRREAARKEANGTVQLPDEE